MRTSAICALLASSSALMMARPAVADDWNGFSVGIGGGYGMADTRINGGVTDLGVGLSAKTDGLPSSGGLFTLSAGYDHELLGPLIAGAFVDYDFSGVGSASTYEIGNQLSVGGRLGYLASPTTLFFSTFGYAHADATDPSVDFVFANIRNGSRGFDGYFVGSGVETQIGGGFSVKAEYRYTSFQSEGDKIELGPDTSIQSSGKPTIQTARLSLNYRFGSGDQGTAAKSPPPITTSWTSPYIGIGAGAGSADTKAGASGLIGDSSHLGNDGGFLSVSVGYDYQLNSRFVVGAFGDASYMHFRYDSSVNITSGFDSLNESIDNKFRNLLMFGGRIGYLARPDTLLFVSGGYANAGLGDTRLSYTESNAPSESATLKGTRFSGGFIGGGIETRINDALSLKAEYRYVDFGREELSMSTDSMPGAVFPPTAFDPTLQIGMLSVNYRFGAHSEQTVALK